ncbi:MAG TPA: hypothetical protein PLY87_01885 [Planctomycetaceae bacterium]|nr:hypothetical protein [Planctomycetaceae bacterium]
MGHYITKVFANEADLRRWYTVFHGGDDGKPETWNGPQSILHGFQLTGESDVYGEGEDVSEIPYTTCFDCGVMSPTGTWNDSLENLLTEFRSSSSIQLDICFDEPLVDPNDWEWRYENPSPYVMERMEDYQTRKMSEESPEDRIVAYYEPCVDAFLRADASEYDVSTDLGEQAKQYIATLTPEDKQRLISLLWRDIIATQLSEYLEVEVEASYLRAKKEFESTGTACT